MHRSTPGGRSSHHARSAPKGFAGTPGDFWMCPPGVCISWAGSRMHRWIRARHDAAAESVRRDLHIATAEASAMQRISGTAGRGDAYPRRSETLVHVCRTQIEKQPRDNPLGCECLVGVRRFELLTSSVSGKRSPPELNARSRVRKCARDNITEPELGGKNIFKNRLHCGIRGLCHIHFKRAYCRDLTVA